MAHEMVHAYDHLRFKMDPFDLRHAACMEVCEYSIHPYAVANMCMVIDPRIDIVGRVQMGPRILYQRPVEHHAAVTGVRATTGDTECHESARL